MLKILGQKARVILSTILAFMLLTSVMVIAPSTTVFAAGYTYYVDTAGNDSNSGTSPSSAWRTLAKVNSMTFAEGDQILFKAGCSWTGELHPLGSGVSGNPIKIDMYGSGNKPLIAGGAGNALVLYNQQYWEISNLEITATGTSGASVYHNGVKIKGNNFGTLNHIYLRNLDMHDIEDSNGYIRAIYFVISGTSTPTKWNDILVEGCNIGPNVDTFGIAMNSSWSLRDGYSTDWAEAGEQGVANAVLSTNVIIRNNYFVECNETAIMPNVTTGAIIENNVAANCTAYGMNVPIWWTCTDNLVCQNNEVYGTGASGFDCQAFDADQSAYNSIVQYNYSHGNPAGFMFFCGSTNTTVRYNISQYDGTAPIQWDTGIFHSNDSGRIHNNTIYGPGPFGPPANNINLQNNIIWSNGSSYAIGGDHNITWGNATGGIHTNPMLVDPGSGGFGRDTVDGYKLQSGSPCINAGIFIPDNGGKDYWGNSVSLSSFSTPNIGACNLGSGGGGGATLSANPTSVTGGSMVTVTFSGAPGTQGDWIALCNAGAPEQSRINWKYTGSNSQNWPASGVTQGTVTFAMPTTAGSYEFRLYTNNEWNRVTTNTCTVTVTGGATLSVSPANVSGGQQVTVSFSGAPGTQGDWIALCNAGAPEQSRIDWKYTGSNSQSWPSSGVTSGNVTFNMPSTAGSYEFRLYTNNEWNRVTTNTCTVTVGQ